MTNSERYSRQIRFEEIGEAGQAKIAGSKVLLVGCGALGTVIASTLVRSGVGELRIADRDFVETSNLQRQFLFDENDVKDRLPKAIAAERKLGLVNSEVKVRPIVKDINPSNVLEYCGDVDLILDGTDNFETRFLINDVSAKLKIPWIYGGCLGAGGQSMTILPGETACLRCLMLDGPPAPGTTATCDTAGIIAPIIGVIASMECGEALKILSGNKAAVSRGLRIVDLWDNQLRSLDLSKLRDSVDCPVCKSEQYDWLDGKEGSQTAILCGRNAVQLSFPETNKISLVDQAEKLKSSGEVKVNNFLLRFRHDGLELTLFSDGRAIISGTEDIARAKSFYAQYVGS